MPDGRIHRPHDKFFKDGFSDPATAAALLRHELPPEIAATIDWDRLRLVPGSFLDEKLDHSESDLLFTAPLLPAPGQEADPDAEVCLHLLFEHQSTRDPFMGLRLLRYMVRIWELWLREHGRTKRLPLIIPVVVAQNRTVWRINPYGRPYLSTQIYPWADSCPPRWILGHIWAHFRTPLRGATPLSMMQHHHAMPANLGHRQRQATINHRRRHR